MKDVLVADLRWLGYEDGAQKKFVTGPDAFADGIWLLQNIVVSGKDT